MPRRERTFWDLPEPEPKPGAVRRPPTPWAPEPLRLPLYPPSERAGKMPDREPGPGVLIIDPDDHPDIF